MLIKGEQILSGKNWMNIKYFCTIFCMFIWQLVAEVQSRPQESRQRPRIWLRWHQLMFSLDWRKNTTVLS